MLSKFLKDDLFFDGNNFPDSYYVEQKVIRDLGLTCKIIDACKKIACYIGRMVIIFNLEKFVVHLDGRMVSIVGKQNRKRKKRYHARFYIIFL